MRRKSNEKFKRRVNNRRRKIGIVAIPNDYANFLKTIKSLTRTAKIMLTSAVQETQNDLPVPAEFITLCMNGVTVETTSKQITVVYTQGAVSLKPDIKPIDPIQL